MERYEIGIASWFSIRVTRISHTKHFSLSHTRRIANECNFFFHSSIHNFFLYSKKHFWVQQIELYAFWGVLLRIFSSKLFKIFIYCCSCFYHTISVLWWTKFFSFNFFCDVKSSDVDENAVHFLFSLSLNILCWIWT